MQRRRTHLDLLCLRRPSRVIANPTSRSRTLCHYPRSVATQSKKGPRYRWWPDTVRNDSASAQNSPTRAPLKCLFPVHSPPQLTPLPANFNRACPPHTSARSNRAIKTHKRCTAPRNRQPCLRTAVLSREVRSHEPEPEVQHDKGVPATARASPQPSHSPHIADTATRHVHAYVDAPIHSERACTRDGSCIVVLMKHVLQRFENTTRGKIKHKTSFRRRFLQEDILDCLPDVCKAGGQQPNIDRASSRRTNGRHCPIARPQPGPGK